MNNQQLPGRRHLLERGSGTGTVSLSPAVILEQALGSERNKAKGPGMN